MDQKLLILVCVVILYFCFNHKKERFTDYNWMPISDEDNRLDAFNNAVAILSEPRKEEMYDPTHIQAATNNLTNFYNAIVEIDTEYKDVTTDPNVIAKQRGLVVFNVYMNNNTPLGKNPWQFSSIVRNGLTAFKNAVKNNVMSGDALSNYVIDTAQAGLNAFFDSVSNAGEGDNLNIAAGGLGAFYNKVIEDSNAGGNTSDNVDIGGINNNNGGGNNGGKKKNIIN